ncbi:MAG TPA: hypothetical protein DCO83_09795 [Mucilaginibacter sp.]|nr:hypothetical protein [Mucilaginibacter sp.]
MDNPFIYMPVFRIRQEEIKVLTSFSFSEQMIPCVEIVKGVLRKPVVSKKKGAVSKPEKSFEEISLPILSAINSKYLFVDLPVHFEQKKKTAKYVLKFLRSVADKRPVRTEYIMKLAPLAHRVIPVISTYYKRTGEGFSIVKQEQDLRATFPKLAFRVLLSNFESDLQQIFKAAQPQDYLIVDLQETVADAASPEIKEMSDAIKAFTNCSIILLGNVVNKDITNVGLKHGELIDEIDTSLMSGFKALGGDGYGDYAGIKKDDITGGGTISPGFIYFDPVDNSHYGFKGSNDKLLSDFITIIVPSVLNSVATQRMQQSGRNYLDGNNKGWVMLTKINQGTEPGKNQAKFKRISMEHYIHCMRTKIDAGDFN